MATDGDTLLNPTQAAILAHVASGRNVFFTGSAGTGKTFTLNQIIGHLQTKYGAAFSKKVAIAAMTGIAASHIDGVTLNSALCLGLPRLVDDVGKPVSRDKAATLEVLLLDEVSMLSAEMLDLLDRNVLQKKIQLIFCGDFFQLSPIETRVRPQQPATPSSRRPSEEILNFGMAFECEAWGRRFAAEDMFLLDKVYRQEDEEFVECLNKIRVGEDALATLRELYNECSREVACPDGIKPTLIYSKNADIDSINAAELAALGGTAVTYPSTDKVFGGFTPKSPDWGRRAPRPPAGGRRIV